VVSAVDSLPIAGPMDAFVRRLVERLLEPSAPLTRNRHFHTFETPEGRRALRLARRLRGLARDIRRCTERGSRPRLRRDETGQSIRMELRFDDLSGRRLASLSREEYSLLLRIPGVPEQLSHGHGADHPGWSDGSRRNDDRDQGAPE
jgi:hypothetical protein